MNLIRKWLGTSGTALLCIIIPVRAQSPSRQPVPKLSFRYEVPSSDTASRADKLIVHVEIAPGWHINSDAPLDDFLVPTRVEAKAEGCEFGKPGYPRPERVHSDAMGGDVLLFSGAFDVVLPFLKKPSSRNADGPGGPRTIVTLKYQACDQATCYPPKEISSESRMAR